MLSISEQIGATSIFIFIFNREATVVQISLVAQYS